MSTPPKLLFLDFHLRKSCGKSSSVTRELAPDGRRSRPKSCRTIKQHPPFVAAGEACVRLRSSRKSGVHCPPETKQPLNTRQLLNQTRFTLSATKYGFWSYTPVCRHPNRPLYSTLRHPGELRLRRSLWRLCVGDFRVCRV